MKYLAVYLIAVSCLAAVLTVYDKIISKTKRSRGGKHRIPENVLLFTGIIGGAAAEYLTMKLIRHKTRHRSFMIGLPVIIVIQASAAAAIYFFIQKG